MPFDYLSKTHVKITVDDKEVAYSWTTAYSICFAKPPSTLAKIVIRRETPHDEPWVVWKDGSVIVASELNAANLQTLYILQEAAFRVSKVESICKSLKETLAAEVALVAVSGSWSVDLTATNNMITALKADKADKTALAALQTVVDKKANKTTVDEALALKANTVAVTSALELKASKTELDALAALHDTVYVFNTVGTHTITAPSWARYAIVSGCGGGGGGGRSRGGGPGGHVVNYRLPITPGKTYTITVGDGGSASGIDGGTGGDTSFGDLLVLGGGTGGGEVHNGAIGASPVAGGYIESNGSNGGSGLFGRGGRERTTYGDGNPGSNRGAGGGGGWRGNTGGVGSCGILMVMWGV